MNPTNNSAATVPATTRAQFIHLWGVSGSSWCVSKTLTQMHALLLVSPAALSTEDQMKRTLDQWAALPADPADPACRAFHPAPTDIQQLATVSDKFLTRLMQAERSWFWDKSLKLFV